MNRPTCKAWIQRIFWQRAIRKRALWADSFNVQCTYPDKKILHDFYAKFPCHPTSSHSALSWYWSASIVLYSYPGYMHCLWTTMNRTTNIWVYTSRRTKSTGIKHKSYNFSYSPNGCGQEMSVETGQSNSLEYAMYCFWEATACDLFSLAASNHLCVDVLFYSFTGIHYSIASEIQEHSKQKTEKANMNFEAKKER